MVSLVEHDYSRPVDDVPNVLEKSAGSRVLGVDAFRVEAIEDRQQRSAPGVVRLAVNLDSRDAGLVV
ncbi:hypothetical protein ACFQO4_19185 [Saliphagus sp. GCM10025334]